MQASALPVYGFDIFGDGDHNFWMGELAGFIDKYSVLKKPHRQNFYMILFLESSLGNMFIDSECISLANLGKAVMIKPDCISAMGLESAAKGHVICFTEQFFLLRYNANILHQFCFLKREAESSIELPEQANVPWRELVRLCFKEFMLGQTEAETVLRSYLNIILFELDRMYHPFGVLKSNTIKQEKVQQFESMIDANYKLHKMPSYYADKLNLSPNYLNKICRSETGHTAGALIRKRRTVEAQRLLQYTNLTVNEVANRLGFERLSYFVTSFKKQTGQTPEQFRKK